MFSTDYQLTDNRITPLFFTVLHLQVDVVSPLLLNASLLLVLTTDYSDWLLVQVTELTDNDRLSFDDCVIAKQTLAAVTQL